MKDMDEVKGRTHMKHTGVGKSSEKLNRIPSVLSAFSIPSVLSAFAE